MPSSKYRAPTVATNAGDDRHHSPSALARRVPLFILAAAALYEIDALSNLLRTIRRIPPILYDYFLLHMTEIWYRTVLGRLDDGAVVLDVGIGTGGALLRCKDLIKSKKLHIFGIDYNDMYISAAKHAINQAGLKNHVHVKCMSVYDAEGLHDLRMHDNKSVWFAGRQEDGEASENCGTGEPFLFDAVYFSGSFSLLPSPKDALSVAAAVLKPQSGLVYITQTYQHHTPPFFGFIKPLMKYVTTIDFGGLIMENDVLPLYSQSGLEVIAHQKIEGSVDNWFQAAYVSILKVASY